MLAPQTGNPLHSMSPARGRESAPQLEWAPVKQSIVNIAGAGGCLHKGGGRIYQEK